MWFPRWFGMFVPRIVDDHFNYDAIDNATVQIRVICLKKSMLYLYALSIRSLGRPRPRPQLRDGLDIFKHHTTRSLIRLRLGFTRTHP